nr:MAG TPA: Translocase [Caudoviricetes sp.]
MGCRKEHSRRPKNPHYVRYRCPARNTDCTARPVLHEIRHSMGFIPQRAIMAV